MRIFGPLYDKVLKWAGHPKASWYLAFVSFIESFFFPVPTAFMLAPMAVAKPHESLRFATIATLFSVLGGVFGYMLGYFAFELVEPWIIQFGYMDNFQLAKNWFDRWGFWALLLAGFSPIPYKIFTVAGGTLSMALVPFIVASLIGRSSQFFFISGAIMLLGPKFEPMIRRYVEILGWLTVALVLGLILYIEVIS